MSKNENKNIYFNFSKLKKDMEGMTFSEKADHIWTYYKEVFWVTGVALLLVFALVGSLVNGFTQKNVFHGVLSNVTITNEGHRYITKDFKKMMGYGKNQIVNVGGHEYKGTGATQDEVENMYSQMMGVLGQVDAKILDYMFLTETTLELFVPQDIYLDLREIYTAEELEGFGSRLRYGQRGEHGEMFPIALNVTEVPFVKKHMYQTEDIWLVFIANTKHKETCRTFWEYLLAWQP